MTQRALRVETKEKMDSKQKAGELDKEKTTASKSVSPNRSRTAIKGEIQKVRNK
jgi:hypothetical protein